MSWRDRLATASYESPTGVETFFDFENVSVEFDKKTSAFTFPDSDGTFVQDLGSTGNRYPLRVFLWGEDYDLTANTFFDSLKEKGPGILNHPVHGSFSAIPFGRIKRRDDLVTAANQAVFEIMFFKVENFTGLLSVSDGQDELQQAIIEFNEQSSVELENELEVNSAVEREEFKNRYQQSLSQVETGLKGIAETQQDVFTAFETTAQSINSSIDILLADPITLAGQTSILIQTPSRAVFSINTRLNGYQALIDIVTNGSPNIANDFYNDRFYGYNLLIGMINSTLNNEFETKPQTVEAIEQILTAFDSLNEWVDANLLNLGLVDSGLSYQYIQETVALTTGFLVDLSFSLKQENIIILDRPRTIIDLAGELYQRIDDETINFIIDSNSLTGSEILELQRGREIVYYV